MEENLKLSPTEVLTEQRMREAYGEFYFASQPIKLDPAEIPAELHPLIPYAEFWGYGFEEAVQLVEHAPEDIRQNLKFVVESLDDPLTHWLAGQSVIPDGYTTEWRALDRMRNAVDYL